VLTEWIKLERWRRARDRWPRPRGNRGSTLPAVPLLSSPGPTDATLPSAPASVAMAFVSTAPGAAVRRKRRGVPKIEAVKAMVNWRRWLTAQSTRWHFARCCSSRRRLPKRSRLNRRGHRPTAVQQPTGVSALWWRCSTLQF
jgi:hypothetical protein